MIFVLFYHRLNRLAYHYTLSLSIRYTSFDCLHYTTHDIYSTKIKNKSIKIKTLKIVFVLKHTCSFAISIGSLKTIQVTDSLQGGVVKEPG